MKKQSELMNTIEKISAEIKVMLEKKRLLESELVTVIQDELLNQYGLTLNEQLEVTPSLDDFVRDRWIGNGRSDYDYEDLLDAKYFKLTRLYTEVDGVFADIEYSEKTSDGRIPVRIVLEMKAAYALKQTIPVQVELFDLE